MKEFPDRRFLVVNKLKQSPTSSTFVVKTRIGEDNSQILKLYSGPSARRTLQTLEQDLCWQRGLRHPHLLGITEAGISGKNSFFTTRPFANSNLDLARASTAHIQQLVEGIRFLHSHERPHGCLKPSNIFVIEDKVCLADLRLSDSAGPHKLEDIRFTAPEILLGETPTIDSDYYSVGAILYRIYAKRDPFDDSIPENLKEKYLHAKIPPIRNMSGSRDSVARVVEGLLRRNPSSRAAAFGELIREFKIDSSSVLRAPMVGRRSTMELLHSQLASKAPKTLGVSLIEGDAGIGKSRLIEELQFKSGLHNAEIFSTACIHQAERNLAPILRLIRAVLQEKCRAKRVQVHHLLGSFEQNLAPLLEDSPNGAPVDCTDQPSERIVQDLIGLIAALSRQETLRLCIEDVDRAEPATLRFLSQVCYRASELDVRLILTCRNSSSMKLPGEMESLLGQALTRISLEQLTKAESCDLVQYLDSKRAKQSEILNRAEGNPLLLLEYARNESNEALATSLHVLIRQEMRGEALKLVRTLAVLRAPASAKLLARVVPLDAESVGQNLLWLRKIGAVHESNQGFEMRLNGLRSAVESGFSAHIRRTTHHALYSVLRSIDGAAEEHLAEHAFHGALWVQAAEHLTSLARRGASQGDHVSALVFYKKLKICLRKLNRPVPFEEEIAIATCLAKTGKLRLADQIYVRLLADSEIQEDLRIRLSLMYRGGDIDNTHLYERLSFLRQALESSKSGQFHASTLLSKLCNASVKAGDLDGAADALDRAQKLLESFPDKAGEMSVMSAKGFLLAHRGDYQNASEIHRKLSFGTLGVRAAALTNRSVCLEYLGSIRSAIVIQNKAYRFATKAGHLVSQFVCLGNLGVFHTKLGSFKEAREYFLKTKQPMEEFGPTAGISFRGVGVEEAVLDMMQGSYDAALKRLRMALSSKAIIKNTRLQCMLLECEIHFAVGADVTALDIDRIAIEGAWSPSPLHAAQLALLRSRTKPTISEAIPVLETALRTARGASLLYEICRLELEVSARLQETDPSAAKPHAEEALRISRKNGYRPLQTRALLLRGMCGSHDKEKAHYLQESFKLASEIGVPEVISESAYHLGVLSQSMQRSAAAREYLSTSARVASEIADQIPAQFQTRYLNMPWRKDARRLYTESFQVQPVRLPSVELGISSRDHHYFRALYKISVAATTAQSVEVFLRELLTAIGFSREDTVVMLKSGDQTTWHSLGASVTGEVRQRVLSIASKSSDQARFISTDRWIPFQSMPYSGGIYVRGRKRNQMGEDEMEFFTILGPFVSSALDRIHNRAASPPVPSSTAAFHGIVGNSRAVRELCAHIENISNSNATVLIQGETGTGNELVARAIHKLSARAQAPFIAIDCGAIPEGLMESELFGSKRGSFTGSVADRPGVFEAAHQGTLFLDEISNMNPGMQAKLLRVLQEREIRRVGETRIRPIDVRLIAASNTNLQQLVAEGAFRQDLLFRLNVISVHIPPLRARRDDIPLLAAHFLKQLNLAQKTSKILRQDALHSLLAHSFPGNIRELQNSIERGFFTASGRTISSIPIDLHSADASIDEVRKWMSDLAEGRKNFWTAIHDRYKSRDISREKVVALMDLGLRTTHGSYKDLASLLHIEPREYRRLMDFLRRNNCLLDFRPYRKVPSLS